MQELAWRNPAVRPPHPEEEIHGGVDGGHSLKSLRRRTYAPITRSAPVEISCSQSLRDSQPCSSRRRSVSASRESVHLDLVLPPLRVGHRPCSMYRAAVPEASVDKDGEANPNERNVDRPPSVARHRVAHPVAHAATVELASELQFRLGVPRPLARHAQRSVAYRSACSAIMARGYDIRS